MIDLQLFCDKSRINLKQPFNDKDYTYATNGHIVVRVEQDPQYDGTVWIDLSKLPFDHDQIEEWYDMPDMPEPANCGACGGTGKVSDCPECDGLKKRHLHFESITYHDYRISLTLLGKLKTLPNVKLGFVPMPEDTTCPPIRFKFDGGCGLLMPMMGKE